MAMMSNLAVETIGDAAKKAWGWSTRGVKNSWDEIANNKKGIIQGIKDGHKIGDAAISQGEKAGLIAGSFITVGAAGRILSGGGVTRDGQGNPNIIGLPFV